MELTTVWFILIAVLWIGYFCLEGFDFGVGMLLPVLGRDDTERRVLINTIGPVWDGNEVWLLVAGGATFAAFPEWYATLFSGFYLPLLLILVALIVRGVAFEYRAKRDDDALARAAGTWRIIVGSFVPALLWGVAFANILRGVPIDADQRVRRRLLRPAQPVRPARRRDDAAAVPDPRRDVRRAQDRRRRSGTGPGRWRCGSALAAAVVAVAFLVWTQVDDRHRRLRRSRSCWLRVALVGGLLAALRRPRGLGVHSAPSSRSRSAVAGLFLALFPDVMPTQLDRRRRADDDQRRGDRLHAEDHDRGRGDLHAGRAALPGLDLLGVPQADRGAPHPGPDAEPRPRLVRPDRPAAPPPAGRRRGASCRRPGRRRLVGSLLVVAQAWAVTGLVLAALDDRRRRAPVGGRGAACSAARAVIGWLGDGGRAAPPAAGRRLDLRRRLVGAILRRRASGPAGSGPASVVGARHPGRHRGRAVPHPLPARRWCWPGPARCSRWWRSRPRTCSAR